MFDLDQWEKFARDELDATDEMIEVSKEGAMQLWLIFIPVAGNA